MVGYRLACTLQDELIYISNKIKYVKSLGKQIPSIFTSRLCRLNSRVLFFMLAFQFSIRIDIENGT